MTAPAIEAVACPKCGAAMYDNRLTKKNPKQPDFKCTRYKEGCEGVIWPPKGFAPKTAPAPKAAPVTSHPMASKPDSQLPPLLRNQQEEDAAELASRVGVDLTSIQKQLALYQSVAEWYLDTIVPILTKSDIGCTPESVAAGIATVFINSTGGKK